MAYLTSRDAAPAMRVCPDTPPAKETRPGKLAVNFDKGALYLVPDSGDPVRAVWWGHEKRRPIFLPPGRYRVKNVAVEKAHEGASWFVSATGGGRTITIQEGEETKFEVDSGVYVKPHTRFLKNELQLLLGVSDDGRAGLTVAKDGKRIPIGYEIFDDKKKLADGAMTYD